MENIRIIKSQSAQFVAAELNTLLISADFHSEMGEFIKWSGDQYWFFAYSEGVMIGFICHNNDTILYAYTRRSFRNKGVFSMLYKEIPEQSWRVNSSNMALPIYLKLGFKILKSYKICHKLMKY